ncbi:MAG: hypothetical protein E7042_02265 [Lentisphaerae bacterium]|nr:hypothetical protein [Lentisphaerota bacterium]
MKNLFFNITAALMIAAIVSGCGDSHPAPPLEQMELTARFFRSIENKQNDTAIRQARKLKTLDPDAAYIDELIVIQESNDTVIEIQKMINHGNISRALQLIRKVRRKYSNNRTFNEVYPKISQLRNAERIFRGLKRAKSSSAMRSARIAAQAGLSLNMTPELERFLADYELRGAAVAAKEKADILAAERAAQEAVIKSRLEDARRKVAEKKFEKETAKKSAEGERLRQRSQFP